MDDYRKDIKSSKVVVVKVGTSTITNEQGHINERAIDCISQQIAQLHRFGKNVILVTSGAIGVGIGKLGLKEKPSTIPQKQACAAVGQSILMEIYEKSFNNYGITLGQVLLTREDVSDRARYLNSRNTLVSLFDYGVIPVINENDTVAVDEIKVGDNDTLAALVSSLIGACLLIILSDIEGVFTADPKHNKDAQLIEVISPDMSGCEFEIGNEGSPYSTGGLKTKIQAARIASGSGIPMIIADGSTKDIILRVLEGESIGTLFMPCNYKMGSRKRWIAYNVQPTGEIIIDQGASSALKDKGKSLLPSGIKEVRGEFSQADCIVIKDESGQEFARGLTNYSSEELNKIIGLQTHDIQSVLGYKFYDEVVHRDNLVCF